MSALAADFEPMAAMDAGDGPTNTMPARAQAEANSSFSDRKP